MCIKKSLWIQIMNNLWNEFESLVTCLRKKHWPLHRKQFLAICAWLKIKKNNHNQANLECNLILIHLKALISGIFNNSHASIQDGFGVLDVLPRGFGGCLQNDTPGLWEQTSGGASPKDWCQGTFTFNKAYYTEEEILAGLTVQDAAGVAI